MTRKLLDEAQRVALKHYTHHPQWDHYIHFSFIVCDGKLLGWSPNREGTPPVHFGYTKDAKLHSELGVYRKVRGLLKGRGFEMINIRLSRQGLFKLSAPCEVCREWLDAVGCNVVYFTLDGGEWGRANL